jgi:general stress protein 26
MSTTETRQLADLAQPGDTAMLVTLSAGRPSSRPLTVASVQTGHLLFMIDRDADWVPSIGSDHDVHVTITAGGRNDWLSVNGHATFNNDPALIRELWTPAASAYFDGDEDPRLVVLDVEVVEGEYWSAPGAGPVGRLISMVSSKLGRHPQGDHGTVVTRS